jgi:hypothetical protein
MPLVAITGSENEVQDKVVTHPQENTPPRTYSKGVLIATFGSELDTEELIIRCVGHTYIEGLEMAHIGSDISDATEIVTGDEVTDPTDMLTYVDWDDS